MQCHQRTLRQLCRPQPSADSNTQQQRFIVFISIIEQGAASRLLGVDQLIRIPEIRQLFAKVIVTTVRPNLKPMSPCDYELYDHLHFSDSVPLSTHSTITPREP
jgi:hypothetical protein